MALQNMRSCGALPPPGPRQLLPSWREAIPCAACHQSRVYALLIDTPAAEAGPAAAFWSAALGATARPVSQEPQFTLLHQALPGLVTAVQAVDDAPRFHLDIETDNAAITAIVVYAAG
jgi:mono/diheme cytochrome c family protein